LRIVLWIRW